VIYRRIDDDFLTQRVSAPIDGWGCAAMEVYAAGSGRLPYGPPGTGVARRQLITCPMCRDAIRYSPRRGPDQSKTCPPNLRAGLRQGLTTCWPHLKDLVVQIRRDSGRLRHAECGPHASPRNPALLLKIQANPRKFHCGNPPWNFQLCLAE